MLDNAAAPMKATPTRPVMISLMCHLIEKNRIAREGADRPVSAVLEVAVLRERAGADQVHGDRTDEHRSDEAQTQGDDDRVGGDRERADDTVERERRVEDLEVEEEEEAGLTGCLRQLGGTAGLLGLFVLGGEFLGVEQLRRDR